MHTLNSPLWGSDLGVGVDLRIRLPSSTMSVIQRLQLGSLKGLGGWGILSYLYAHTHTLPLWNYVPKAAIRKDGRLRLDFS